MANVVKGNDRIHNLKYDNSKLVSVTINNNGDYLTFGENSSGGSGPSGTFISKTITSNGTYTASTDNVDGYNPVIVNVPGAKYQNKTLDIIENGTYNVTPDSGFDGISQLTVNVNGTADMITYKREFDEHFYFVPGKINELHGGGYPEDTAIFINYGVSAAHNYTSLPFSRIPANNEKVESSKYIPNKGYYYMIVMNKDFSSIIDLYRVIIS